MEMVVPTAPISGLGTERIVSWAGVLLQEPHRSAAQQRKTMPEGVYSSWWSNGSPAHMYGLRATVWVTEVDGKPVKSLDRLVCLPAFFFFFLFFFFSRKTCLSELFLLNLFATASWR